MSEGVKNVDVDLKSWLALRRLMGDLKCQ